MSPVDYYGYLDYDYPPAWYQGDTIICWASLYQPFSEDSQPLAGETVELGLAVCLPVLVLLVFLGSVSLQQEVFHFTRDLLSTFSYVLTVLWRCWSKEKLQTNQKPAWSNLPNQTRDYKMLSNSQTQTSLLHLHPSSPETTTGRLHIR